MNTIERFNKIVSEKGYTDPETIEEIFKDIERLVMDRFDYYIQFEETGFTINKNFADEITSKFTENEIEKLIGYANEYLVDLADDLLHNPNSYAVVSRDTYDSLKNSWVMPHWKYYDKSDAERLLLEKQKEDKEIEYVLARYSDTIFILKAI